MASAAHRQRHLDRWRRIFDSALGLQRHLSNQHRAGFRLSKSPARPCRSVSLQRDRDADFDVLNEAPKPKTQAPGKSQASNPTASFHADVLELRWGLGF